MDGACGRRLPRTISTGRIYIRCVSRLGFDNQQCRCGSITVWSWRWLAQIAGSFVPGTLAAPVDTITQAWVVLIKHHLVSYSISFSQCLRTPTDVKTRDISHCSEVFFHRRLRLFYSSLKWNDWVIAIPCYCEQYWIIFV